jgi:hypothetical protein
MFVPQTNREPFLRETQKHCKQYIVFSSERLDKFKELNATESLVCNYDIT